MASTASAAEPLETSATVLVDEPPPSPERLEELHALGYGQLRDVPVPVPDHLPRLNAEPRPLGGGAPPQVIFINFDGASLVAGPDSAQMNSTQIPGLEGEFAPYGDAPEAKAAIVQAVGVDFEAYNLAIVTTRPESGEYAMTMVGPTNPFGGGVLGIAPLDCANMQTHSNVSFAFHSAGDGFDPITAASTISHEQGHAFGLDHVNDEMAMMNPVNVPGDPTFPDDCRPLTDGPGAACAAVHETYCPDGAPTQNSHLELLALFGPAIPDVEGPIITVTAPLNGTVYEDGDGFTVIAEIVDESTVEEATLYIDGAVVGVDTTDPWGWEVMDLPGGVHTLEITAIDEFGNEGLSNPVSILVEGGDPMGVDESGTGGPPGGTTGGPGGMMDTDGLVPGNPDGCGCTTSEPAPAWAAGLWLLALVRRRRRD